MTANAAPTFTKVKIQNTRTGQVREHEASPGFAVTLNKDEIVIHGDTQLTPNAPKKSMTLGESYLVTSIRDLESSSRELSFYIDHRPEDVRAKELLEFQRLLHGRMLALCHDRRIPV